MPRVNIEMHWNDKEIDKLMHRTMVPEAVARAAGHLRDRSKQVITDAGRVDTGALRNSLTSSKIARSDKNSVWYQVGSNLSYALYQHNGVKGPIRPKRAKFLRFKPKGSTVFVFARKVKGFKGIFYLTKPLRKMTPEDFTP